MRRNSPKWDPEYEDELDELIRDAFMRSPHTSLPAETLRRESWMKVSRDIKRNKRLRSVVRRFKWLGLIAASLALGAFLLSPLVMTKAVSPLNRHVEQTVTGTAHVERGSDTFKPAIQEKPSHELGIHCSEHAERVTNLSSNHNCLGNPLNIKVVLHSIQSYIYDHVTDEVWLEAANQVKIR